MRVGSDAVSGIGLPLALMVRCDKARGSTPTPNAHQEKSYGAYSFDQTWDLVRPVAKTSRSNQLYRSVLSPKQAP
ncbi:hypothetical protein BJP36_39540 [Moorena producens JHB]|uniref:Uncharacterized protein n=2 Tax=Coleofasciculaceae TaxID=1892251 RepID=A0A9Q9SV14_MOOP1|nr:hypothetical protein [Moorena producens]WAN70149.1 hypothetical protein BJP36_39540 [Moorena producens JHB]